MHLILFNLGWMSFNIYLALIAVTLGWLFLKTRSIALKIIFGIIWILFLPNTLYMFTDIINIAGQWERGGIYEKIVFVFQYGILEAIGFISFILAIYPAQLFLNGLLGKRKKQLVDTMMVFLNFVVGFGIVLGRTERVNSWEVFTHVDIVLRAMVHVLQTPELLVLSLLFGLLASFSYYLLSKPVMKQLGFVDKRK